MDYTAATDSPADDIATRGPLPVNQGKPKRHWFSFVYTSFRRMAEPPGGNQEENTGVAVALCSPPING